MNKQQETIQNYKRVQKKTFRKKLVEIKTQCMSNIESGLLSIRNNLKKVKNIRMPPKIQRNKSEHRMGCKLKHAIFMEFSEDWINREILRALSQCFKDVKHYQTQWNFNPNTDRAFHGNGTFVLILKFTWKDNMSEDSSNGKRKTISRNYPTRHQNTQ